MSSVFVPVLSGVLLLCFLLSEQVDAQIGADEASRDYMAAMCAHSAGGRSEQYREYGARLAMTLSMLGAEQQRRVFGYLPIPGAALKSGDLESEVIAAIAAQTEEAAVKAAPEEPGVLDEVIEFFAGLQSKESGADAVIAGTVPGTEESETASAGTSGTGGEANSASLSSDSGKGDASPDGKKDEDGNNGHGNSGGYDPSNPGKGKK